nr:MAG TPA: hypothetical protein [Crassvirales sp.]
MLIAYFKARCWTLSQRCRINQIHIVNRTERKRSRSTLKFESKNKPHRFHNL